MITKAEASAYKSMEYSDSFGARVAASHASAAEATAAIQTRGKGNMGVFILEEGPYRVAAALPGEEPLDALLRY